MRESNPLLSPHKAEGCHYPNPDTHPLIVLSRSNTLRHFFPTPLTTCPDNPQVRVAITDKIYLKNHRQLAAQLEVSLPRGAFHGATLDLLFTGDGIAELDDASRERVLAFAEDFLDCDCEDNPYCGHPERKFIQYLLALRVEGESPEGMVESMTAEYMVYAYPGDILSFLDDAVRTLEAVEDLAGVDGYEAVAGAAGERREDLIR